MIRPPAPVDASGSGASTSAAAAQPPASERDDMTEDESFDEDGDEPQPRQRDSGLGVRIVGRLVYDSLRGTTCHWCRQKTMRVHVPCTVPACTQAFCQDCLRNRHGEDVFAAIDSERWVCPFHRGSCGEGCVNCCNCSICRPKIFKLPATGYIKNKVLAAGFDNAHDYLVHLATGQTPEQLAARKRLKPYYVPPPPADAAAPPAAAAPVAAPPRLDDDGDDSEETEDDSEETELDPPLPERPRGPGSCVHQSAEVPASALTEGGRAAGAPLGRSERASRASAAGRLGDAAAAAARRPEKAEARGGRHAAGREGGASVEVSLDAWVGSASAGEAGAAPSMTDLLELLNKRPAEAGSGQNAPGEVPSAALPGVGLHPAGGRPEPRQHSAGNASAAIAPKDEAEHCGVDEPALQRRSSNVEGPDAQPPPSVSPGVLSPRHSELQHAPQARPPLASLPPEVTPESSGPNATAPGSAPDCDRRVDCAAAASNSPVLASPQPRAPATPAKLAGSCPGTAARGDSASDSLASDQLGPFAVGSPPVPNAAGGAAVAPDPPPLQAIKPLEAPTTPRVVPPACASDSLPLPALECATPRSHAPTAAAMQSPGTPPLPASRARPPASENASPDRPRSRSAWLRQLSEQVAPLLEDVAGALQSLTAGTGSAQQPQHGGPCRADSAATQSPQLSGGTMPPLSDCDGAESPAQGQAQAPPDWKSVDAPFRPADSTKPGTPPFSLTAPQPAPAVSHVTCPPPAPVSDDQALARGGGASRPCDPDTSGGQDEAAHALREASGGVVCDEIDAGPRRAAAERTPPQNARGGPPGRHGSSGRGGGSSSTKRGRSSDLAIEVPEELQSASKRGRQEGMEKAANIIEISSDDDDGHEDDCVMLDADGGSGPAAADGASAQVAGTGTPVLSGNVSRVVGDARRSKNTIGADHAPRDRPQVDDAAEAASLAMDRTNELPGRAASEPSASEPSGGCKADDVSVVVDDIPITCLGRTTALLALQVVTAKVRRPGASAAESGVDIRVDGAPIGRIDRERAISALVAITDRVLAFG